MELLHLEVQIHWLLVLEPVLQFHVDVVADTLVVGLGTCVTVSCGCSVLGHNTNVVTAKCEIEYQWKIHQMRITNFDKGCNLKVVIQTNGLPHCLLFYRKIRLC